MSQYFRKYIKKDYFPLHPNQIKFKTFFNNCILGALQQRGYKQTQIDDWNIYWCEKQFLADTLDKMRLHPHKRVNHFRNWYEICRKDLLAKNIKKYKKQLEKQGNSQEAACYDFSPLTYNLPTEYPIFLEQYKRANKAVWIMKPIGKSQGKGIFLFNKISQIQQWSQTSNQPEPYIVQRYIHNPLLIGHKKFDMRLYALVTSHNPLTIYIYRAGFGRFTHMRYDVSDINALDAHLTNVAVQKNSQNYDEERGGKYFVDKLRLYMNSKFGLQKVDKCFAAVQQLMIKTLIATSKIMINDKKCFQLYGYDVMIDSNLKPWLIEINGSPSMSANTETDSKLKMGMLDDVFTVINLQRILVGDEEQVGGFDLVYKDGKKFKANVLDFNNGLNPMIAQKKDFSMIGTYNNRDQNLRKMAKMRAIRLTQQYNKNAQTSSSNTATSSNTNTRNIRNVSINAVSSTNNNNRGRSVVLNSQKQQTKTTMMGVKKGSNLGEEVVLKLPKVLPANSNNVNGNANLSVSQSNGGSSTGMGNKNVSMYRAGSRDSKR